MKNTELLESEAAEWEATVDSWRMFTDYDMVDYDRIRIDDIKAFITHQRQQAVAEFAREVVAHVDKWARWTPYVGKMPLVERDEVIEAIERALDRRDIKL